MHFGGALAFIIGCTIVSVFVTWCVCVCVLVSFAELQEWIVCCVLDMNTGWILGSVYSMLSFNDCSKELLYVRHHHFVAKIYVVLFGVVPAFVLLWRRCVCVCVCVCQVTVGLFFKDSLRTAVTCCE